MTKKQIETLKVLAAYSMTSDFLNDDQKMDKLNEIKTFVLQARDLFLIDNKKADKIINEIMEHAIQEYSKKTKAA